MLFLVTLARRFFYPPQTFFFILLHFTSQLFVLQDLLQLPKVQPGFTRAWLGGRVQKVRSHLENCHRLGGEKKDEKGNKSRKNGVAVSL